MMGKNVQGLGPSMLEVPPLWLTLFYCMGLKGTGRYLMKMRRGRGKGKEDKILEKVGRMSDYNNTGQGQGRAGKTQNMSQATFSHSLTVMHVCSV